MEPGLTAETKRASPWEASAGTWQAAGAAVTALAPTTGAQQDSTIPATVIRALNHPIRAALPRCAVRAGVLCIRTSRIGGSRTVGCGARLGGLRPLTVRGRTGGTRRSCFYLLRWYRSRWVVRVTIRMPRGCPGSRSWGRRPRPRPETLPLFPGFRGNIGGVPDRSRMAGSAGAQGLTFITILNCDFNHTFGAEATPPDGPGDARHMRRRWAAPGPRRRVPPMARIPEALVTAGGTPVPAVMGGSRMCRRCQAL